jgi:hypothetical protein
MKTAWKVLKKGMKSSNGDITWKKGKWIIHKGKLQPCNSGLHASNLLFDAIQFVTPGIICKVEYGGNIVEEKDKFVCNKMRVIETYRFTKRNAVEFSIFCARLCLENFEKQYPDDKRPRLAIEAAEDWLKKPSQKNRSAAMSAARSAAMSAESAESAESAARSAESAESAAWSAAWSAESAARSAELSAKEKMEKKLLQIIKAK